MYINHTIHLHHNLPQTCINHVITAEIDSKSLPLIDITYVYEKCSIKHTFFV